MKDPETEQDLQAALRLLKIQRGLASQLQTNCLKLMEAAGEVQTEITYEGMDQPLKVGELSFSVMYSAQIVQRQLHSLSNELRRIGGLDAVPETPVQAAFQDRWMKLLRDAREQGLVKEGCEE